MRLSSGPLPGELLCMNDHDDCDDLPTRPTREPSYLRSWLLGFLCGFLTAFLVGMGLGFCLEFVFAGGRGVTPH